MKAPTGSSKLKVSGSSSAIVSAGPMPGSTPTNVPSSTPSSAYSRLAGSSTVPKPSMSCESASTAQVIGVRPGGRSTPRNSVKATKSSSAERDAHEHVAQRRAAPQQPGDGREEERGGQHVAQRVQQQRVGDQGDEHADRRAPLRHLPLARGPLGQVDVGAHDRAGEEQQREDEQGGADQQRHEARAGRGVALGRADRRGGDQHRHRDAEQDQPPGARTRPGARRRLVHSPSPRSAMMRSTRRFSAARKRVNSSPGL